MCDNCYYYYYYAKQKAKAKDNFQPPLIRHSSVMSAYYYPSSSTSSASVNTYQSNSGYRHHKDDHNHTHDDPNSVYYQNAYAHDSFIISGNDHLSIATGGDVPASSSSSFPNHLSPLASLVRRASSRKIAARHQQQHGTQDLNSNSHTNYDDTNGYDDTNTTSDNYIDYIYNGDNHNDDYIVSPSNSNSNPIPRRLMANLRLDVDSTPVAQQRQEHPASPLLHSHFARASIATASSSDDRSRYSNSQQSETSYRDDESYREEYEYFRDDDGSSVYSQSTQGGFGTGPALRDSWNSTATGGTIQRGDYNTAATVERRPSMPLRAVTAATTYSNASVDVGMHSEGVRVTPQLPADMREQKRKVLERNMNAKRVSSAESVRTVRGGGSASTPLGIPQVTVRPPSSYSVKSETPSMLTTPQEYLQQGIQHHEANRLGESARCFERSAIEGGGCGVGMLMYGLTLRHGWGCAKNEKMGFKWLMKAAEHAVGDLERLRTGGGQEAAGVVETELVLAIYEVGQCFFHGWGVAKDQKMAVSYYSVAARLGDGDAQADYAYCLANGKGCKKDKKEAADWYRKAIAQGQSDVGLAWIYKDKYSS